MKRNLTICHVGDNEALVEAVFGDKLLCASVGAVQSNSNENDIASCISVINAPDNNLQKKPVCLSLIFKTKESIKIFREWLDEAEIVIDGIESGELDLEHFKKEEE